MKERIITQIAVVDEADPIEFQKKVRNIYLRQASLDPDFIRVDCSGEDGRMLPPDDIFAKVKAVTDEHLTGK